MHGQRRCVYTTLIGNYETLNEQPMVHHSSIKFICLTDSDTVSSDTWEIKRITPLFPQDPVRSQRDLKIRCHTHLPEYDTSLYIDNSVILSAPPEKLFETFMMTKAACSIALHDWNTTLMDEFVAVLCDGLDDETRIREQLTHYHEACPSVLDDNVYWTGILLRQHGDPLLIRMMDIWRDHVLRYSRRDQLSINWAAREAGLCIATLDINNHLSAFHSWPHTTNRQLKRRNHYSPNTTLPPSFKERKKARIQKQYHQDILRYGKILALLKKWTPKPLWLKQLRLECTLLQKTKQLKLKRVLKSYGQDYALRAKLEWQWLRYKSKRPVSAAPQETDLLISLTSYPPRFPTLHLTLKSLLIQSHQPNRVVLWIADEDMPKLPREVLALQPYGLLIQQCENMRSHTKLIPCLKKYPNNTIVTADDDIYYERNWLKKLVEAQRPNTAEIICHRMHRIRCDEQGYPLPYQQWEYESNATEPSTCNFATGVMGVLYPPQILHPSVLDVSTALGLCPTADDVWFYWMARLNDAPIRRVKQPSPLHCWRQSQHVTLAVENTVGGQNDVQIKQMIAQFGLPIEKTMG